MKPLSDNIQSIVMSALIFINALNIMWIYGEIKELKNKPKPTPEKIYQLEEEYNAESYT